MPGLVQKRASPYAIGSLFLVGRRGVYHINGTHEGKRIRVTTKCGDLPSAKRALEELSFRLTSGWRDSAMKADADWMVVARLICARHRTHAKVRGLPFEIEAVYVYSLMAEAGFRCAVSGIAFSRPRRRDEPGRDPWAPSIDRIENRHGYVVGNIRVVTLAANLAMNQWGYDTLLRLSKAVVGNAAAPKPEKLTHQLNSDGVGAEKPLSEQYS